MVSLYIQDRSKNVALILSKIPGKISQASAINHLKDAGVVITISQKRKNRKTGS